ncbi:MAG: JDVT-CTERM domain-containing protein [Gammaproteobacteria bacterium]|nr:JDVT-CTERM domain-containing protein [Gammaproteobacteria bacterium]
MQPLASSTNDSYFSSTQTVTGFNADGSVVAEAFEWENDSDIRISAAPAYDLLGDRVSISRGETVTRDIGRGLEPGYLFQYTAHVAAAGDSGALGISTLSGSYSFSPGLQAFLSDGETPFDLLYAVTNCDANRYDWPRTVYGDETHNPAVSIERKVPHSGDCEITGDIANGYTLTVTGTDTSGVRFPTETLDGSALTAGPYFVAAHSLEVFVPTAELDRSDGIADDNRGQLVIGACLSDFDPVGDGGVSNFLDDVEPGYNGAAMSDGSASNNCAERTVAQLSSDGQFSFRAVSTENDEGNETAYLPLISGFHEGDGLVEPGQSFGTLLFYNNNSSTPLSNFSACTVFDTTVQKITDRSAIGASEGVYAYEGSDNAPDFNPAEWQLQYGIASVSDDDPLASNTDSDSVNGSGLNPETGRYHGSWDRLRSLRCDSPTITWFDTLPEERLDEINIVRYQGAFSGKQLLPGQEIRLVVPLQARETFNGGPHSGEEIPTGTVAAAFGSFRSDEFMPNWNTNSYQPAPENTSVDGDRMTIVRAAVDVAVSTAVPEAAPGVVESLLAGYTVVWQLDPVVQSDSFTSERVDNITLTAILSEGSEFNPGCTAISSATSAPVNVETDTPLDGQTRLTWSLSSAQANQALSSISVCADTDPALPAGTAQSIDAWISADNTVTSRVYNQQVNLGQAGAIYTEVSAASVFSTPGDALEFNLSWQNLSATSELQKPVAINVFPYNGDSSGLSARAPASDFSGSLRLVGEPDARHVGEAAANAATNTLGTFFYTADAPETIDHNPETNESNWCSYAADNFVASDGATTCPADWSEVTGLKFESSSDLQAAGNAGSGISIGYQLATSGNEQGDRYTNTFGVGSASLPPDQFLVSRHGSVGIVSFSVEGQVFAAIDDDLEFTDGSDAPVPDGIEVQLLESSTSELVESTTTTEGTYRFNALIPGEYILMIPASVFADNGALPGWSAARKEGQISEFIDPAFSDAAVDGVRSLPVSIVSNPDTGSATANALVNLPLQPNDADGDGIPDLEEFGGNGFITGSVDTDGDGIPDYIDTDSDGDGIPDIDETNIDTDGDGIPDYIDTDSDADGLTDELEGSTDTDGDGIIDAIDAVDNGDLDGDTIPDSVEGDIDTDGDGLPNNQDTDSDGDGIEDSVEKNTDTDGDGIPNYIDTDSDADNIPDSVEGTADLNGNGVPDYIDNETDADTDGDGIPDFIEGAIDTDGDGTIDLEDLDSDGDGIPDQVETVEDTDGDGQANYVDLDSDNDSIPDSIETATDSDADLIANYIDLDSDNDGIFDLMESGNPDTNRDGQMDNLVDSNADGIDDAKLQSGEFIIDTDFDGVADFIDVDSDNDSITDLVETRGVDVDLDRDGRADTIVDGNGDGATESIWTTGLFIIDLDQDNDGDINPVDLDSDGDTRSDLTESGQVDRNGDFIVDPMTDTDKDAVQDPADVDQTGGEDADADGIDDRADIDFVVGTDTDGDGIVDSIDADADGNGHADPTHFDPELGSIDYPDRDNNGIPDFQQPISGILFSGVGGEGIGCAISNSDTRDPTLLLLVLVSLLYLGRRQRFNRKLR